MLKYKYTEKTNITLNSNIVNRCMNNYYDNRTLNDEVRLKPSRTYIRYIILSFQTKKFYLSTVLRKRTGKPVIHKNNIKDQLIKSIYLI